MVLDEEEARGHRVRVIDVDMRDSGYPDKSHSECKHCGAEVAWPMVAVTEREFMAGRTTYTIDGERVTEEQWKAGIAVMKEETYVRKR